MSITNALDAVEQRIQAFPLAVHTEDPRTLLSRILASRDSSYTAAVTRAALAVVLVDAIDRAEALHDEAGEAA